jgi:hypothetical protein
LLINNYGWFDDIYIIFVPIIGKIALSFGLIAQIIHICNIGQQIFSEIKDRIMSNKLEIIKKCEYCGKRFVAQRTTTRYCSHPCNSRAYKEDKKKRKVVGLNHAVMFAQILGIADHMS